MITNEMVEKANRAITDADAYSKDFLSVTGMRAALEAVAPMLIAQGMREAAETLTTYMPSHHAASNRILARARDHILARAQELDPK